jgi:hypothetical protein
MKRKHPFLHPDAATRDWVLQKGEWSVRNDERFQKHLEMLFLNREFEREWHDPTWYG